MGFGDRVKYFRELRGLTQEQLAFEVGVAKTTITGYEKGNRQPDVEKIKKIASALCVSGNELLGIESEKEKTPSISDEALNLARDYDGLDGHGKRVVRLVADEEKSRCKAEREEQLEQAAEALREQREQSEAAEELDIYSIPLYFLPMSAGTGQIAAQEYPEDFLLKKRPPRGTSFIACVSGNSMEPTYHDGDLVFVHATVDIRPGQTGAFLMDGQLWIKELGNGVLISHNPDYEPRQFTEDIRCQGLVLGVCDESYFK